MPAVSFAEWTDGRELPSLSTNFGAHALPFQNWRHFKEAFTPELVARAITQCQRPVKRCIDPFGGSGTTALTCQFMGIHPVTIEVNPFLADLIESKILNYDCDDLARDLGKVISHSNDTNIRAEEIFAELPITFVEPGKSNRWIFDRKVATRIASYRNAIDKLADYKNKLLFRVLLGGILIKVSNVNVNGKGRRYRKYWETNRREAELVDQLFQDAAYQAILEINKYGFREYNGYDLFRGDSRELIKESDMCDLAIFSPPYPNSFDYTDVYNVELWTLGYLKDFSNNRKLRESTLSSHVQISREYAPAPKGSPLLNRTIKRLTKARSNLWSKDIPEMVGSYFADMLNILNHLSKKLSKNGEVWMVVGDSRYDNVLIKSAKILSELAPRLGYQIHFIEPFRSMRTSPQKGGKLELTESLLVLSSNN